MLVLNDIRIKLGLTWKELSDKTNIPQRTLEDLSARGDGRVSTVIQIAKALDLTVEDLWQD